jgi:hypothetical protein
MTESHEGGWKEGGSPSNMPCGVPRVQPSRRGRCG